MGFLAMVAGTCFAEAVTCIIKSPISSSKPLLSSWIWRSNTSASTLGPFARLSTGASSSSASHFQARRWNALAKPRVGSRSSNFASREEVPSEVLEDSKFVRITDEDPRFGPPVLLLLGFDNQEALRVQTLLKEMEGDFLQVLLCTEKMAQGTLGEAVNVGQQTLTDVEVANGLPRIAFISGLTGEELMMLIQVFPEAGLKPNVFAAHVPKNSAKPLRELMEEIMGDHERLSQQRKSADA